MQIQIQLQKNMRNTARPRLCPFHCVTLQYGAGMLMCGAAGWKKYKIQIQILQDQEGASNLASGLGGVEIWEARWRSAKIGGLNLYWFAVSHIVLHFKISFFDFMHCNDWWPYILLICSLPFPSCFGLYFSFCDGSDDEKLFERLVHIDFTPCKHVGKMVESEDETAKQMFNLQCRPKIPNIAPIVTH